MKIPQSLDGATCEQLVSRWLISPDLASRLLVMNQAFRAAVGSPLRIISGHRTADEQRELDREGRPTAPVDRSTHTSCPATGADLLPEIAVVPRVQDEFGRAAIAAGLRWGGGSHLVNGRPFDWNHVDLGPRS